MPRVLLVSARFPPDLGGVETHVAEVAPRLAARGFEVTVLTTDRAGDRPPLEAVDGYEVVRVRAHPADRDWYVAPGLVAALRAGRPDLIHVQGYHTAVAPLAMATAIACRVPFVVTFHSGGHPSALRTRLRGLQRLALRPGFRAAERLVAVSRFELELFRRELRLSPSRFALIRNGSSLPRPRTERRPGGSVVVSLGRLEAYKGHRRVLAAWPEVLVARPDANLAIVGTGPDEAKLGAMVVRLGLGDRVTIGSIPPAERQGMADLLGAANLVVLLSDYEAHPVAVTEALAVGTPVLVARTSGLTELVDQGLARGVSATAGSQEVARAIVAALDAPAGGDGARALSRMSRDARIPTWDDTAATLGELYREILR